jgi:hypothetical protein
MTSAIAASAIDARACGTIPPYPRKSQQILNQGLHAQSSLAGIADEFIGVLVELAAIAFAEQLGVRRHHAQRLLQVVRRHIRELLEIRIGACELFDFSRQVLFRLPAQTKQTFFLQRPADRFRQPRQAVFQNVIRCAALDALDRGYISQCARDQDQWDVQPFTPQHIERVHAFPLRQVVVGEHHVGTVRSKLQLKLGFHLHYNHGSREAAATQSLGYELRIQFVVFNVQHP